MPLFPPQGYRKTEFTHRIGTAANRPAAANVLPGTLYFSTDTLVLERSDGAAWAPYGGGGGSPGAQGPMGPMGFAGENGEDAIFGPQGNIGPQGTQGIQGIQGPIGPPGLSGDDGDIGPDGPPGLQGIQGVQGIQGAQGAIGPPGFDGESEYPLIIPGPQGATGASGASAYTNFTKDLGVSNRAGTFDITGLSGLTVDKNVSIIQTMQKITSKGDARDEFEMQPIILTGYVLDANTIRALWNCDSVCVGTYAFAYAVSG